MIDTDFVPDSEFNRIFDRVIFIVDLRGAKTPAEINKRLKMACDQARSLRRTYRPKLSQGWISFLRKLVPSFGRRTIDEAVANPRGKVALTLKYGRKKAKDILLDRARRRLGSLRARKRKRG